MRRAITVTITDTSANGQSHTIYADPTADGLIIVDVNGYDVAGVDLAAGTVGAWDGDQDDPENRTWKVVDTFRHPVGTDPEA